MQASSTQKTKDSAGRRLGVKKFGGEEVFPDDILIRQRGYYWHPGQNTYVGKDHTIHAKCEGTVRFERDPHNKTKRYIVHVDQTENPNRLKRPPPPFCYHPELYPELAQYNPQPTNHKINKKIVQEKEPKNVGLKISKPLKVNVLIPSSYLLKTEQQNLSELQQAVQRVQYLEAKYLNQYIDTTSTTLNEAQ